MKWMKHIWSMLVLGLTLTSAPFYAPAQSYTVRELPPLAGHATSIATALNNKGEMAGNSTNSGGTQTRGIYSPPPYTSSASIGTYENRTFSYATSINNSAVIAGYAEGTATPPRVPIVWAANCVTVTNYPGGSSTSRNWDINNQGVVVGESPAVGYTHNDGVITDMAPPVNFSSSMATAINDSGVVVGFSNSTNPIKTRATKWVNGSGTELQVLSASNSKAYDIGNNGAIVGVSGTANGDRAFMLTPDDIPVNLGVLTGDTRSEALSTNGTDTVGFSFHPTPGNRAVLFQGGQVINLNDRILPTSGWELIKATGINAHGQICGEGKLNGVAKGFLLTPNPPVGGAADWDFVLEGENSWTAVTSIPPFEPAEAQYFPSTGWGIRADGFPAFGFLQSPEIPLQSSRRYRVWCTIWTSASSPDVAPQIRFRLIEATTNVSSLLSLDSVSTVMPGTGVQRTYQFSLTTLPIVGAQNYRLNLDYTFFNPFDDGDAWIYLERVLLLEE